MLGLSDEEFKKINEMVDDYAYNKDNLEIINDIDNIMQYCLDIINQPFLSVERNDYSTYYDINECINIISKFLKEINPTLETQFLNIISQVNENGEPYVHFINTDKNYYKNHPEELNENIKKEFNLPSRVDSKGIYIQIEHNLNDIFTILHEVLHYMNDVRIVESTTDEKIFTTDTHFNLTEPVSIIAEKMLAQYLIKHNFINNNDYNLRMNYRLLDSKYTSYSAFLECIFIKMCRNGINISSFNYLDYGLNEINKKYSGLVNALYKATSKDKILIEKELKSGKLQLPIHLGYIRAQHMSDIINYDEIGISIFKELNKTAGDINGNISSIKI